VPLVKKYGLDKVRTVTLGVMGYPPEMVNSIPEVFQIKQEIERDDN